MSPSKAFLSFTYPSPILPADDRGLVQSTPVPSSEPQALQSVLILRRRGCRGSSALMTELETNAQRDRRVMADMPFPHSAPANPLLPPERVAEFCREGYVSCQPPPSPSLCSPRPDPRCAHHVQVILRQFFSPEEVARALATSSAGPRPAGGARRS